MLELEFCRKFQLLWMLLFVGPFGSEISEHCSALGVGNTG
jgi:hypothetical protein